MGITFSIFLIGFTASAAQIIILRELLVVFYGNEISIGFILASWLFWGAAGSWFLGRISGKFSSVEGLFSLCQISVPLFLVLSIVTVRLIKPVLGLAPGEIIGFSPMAVSSFVVLAPICMLLGFMFSLSCRIYRPAAGFNSPQIIGRAYGWESIGALSGGLFSSLILVRLPDSLSAVVLLGLLNALAVYVSCSKKINSRKIFSSAIIMAMVFFWASGFCTKVSGYLQRKQWHGYRILGSANSIYGNIVVTKRGGLYSFFNNGLHLYSVPDRQFAEEAVHFALLEHPYPENVLLVGGGAGGLIREALRHPVKNIDYLELDPLVMQMAEKYLPPEESKILKDSRVSIYNLDARSFIKTSRRKYDCVIIHLGDPYTAQVNRYYTAEFFREVKDTLDENGIFSFSLTASESYISPELAKCLQSVYSGLREVFGDILVIPGENACFIASDKPGMISGDYSRLMKQAYDRGLDLKYVREYYLFPRFSPELMGYIDGVLRKLDSVKPNHDFSPSAYYYNMIFWASRMKDDYLEKILKAADYKNMAAAISGVCALIILYGLMQLARKRFSYKVTGLLSFAIMSFSVMAFQIIVLFSFQAIYGYIFYKIGLLIALFMAGLALGSFWASHSSHRFKNPPGYLALICFLFCVFISTMPVVLSWLASVSRGVIPWIGSNLVFPLLSLAPGLFAGAQFVFTNKLCLGQEGRVGEAAGLTYGLDLLGSCCGALLTGIFLIPGLGIFGSCYAVVAINLSAFGIFLLIRPRGLTT